MILSINDINKIVKTEHLLQIGTSKEKFFLQCFDVIGPRLKEHFRDDYLFFNLYYVGEDFTLVPIRLDSGDSSEARVIAEHLQFAEKHVKSKRSKSFTEIILTKNLWGLVLHNSKEMVVIGDVIEQDVTAANYKHELALKLGVSLGHVDKIAGVYNKLAGNYQQPFFIHFIRPFASHQHYNGIFLLFLKRSLTPDEYTELALVWGKVLSEQQINEFSKESNRKLLDSLNKELSHIWNDYFESIRNTVEFDVLPAAAAGDLEKVKTIRDYLLAMIAPAARVQRFFTNLSKAGEISNGGSMKPDIERELGPESFDVKNLVLDTLVILKAYYNPGDKSFAAEVQSIEYAILALKEEPSGKGFFNVPAVEIVLINLLKNALVHSPPADKFVTIQIIPVRNFINVQIVNNGLIGKDWVCFMNQRNQPINKIEFAYGIRTIKRITEFKFPGVKSNLVITAKRMAKEKRTQINLKIPLHHEPET